MTETQPQPEFSRPVEARKVSGAETVLRIEADAAERAALARRFDLRELRALVAEVRLRRLAGGDVVQAATDFHADVIQSCVVTLDPVTSVIEGRFERRYDPRLPAGPEAAADVELDEIVDAEEEPADPLVAGVFDIGEAVAEELGLSLDPFPRSEGARFDGFETGGRGDGGGEASGPFAALARLKRGTNSSGR